MKREIAIVLCLLQLFLMSACISSDDLNKAYNQGYDDGWEKGLEIGLETGGEQGYSEGYEDGYSDGLWQASKSVPSRSSSADSSFRPSSSDYILNTSTKKFHYPSCSTVGQMKEENKQYFSGSRSEIIAMGYDPCGRCKP